MPEILVLALGGTIAMAGDARERVTPRLSGKDLVGAVPELADLAELAVESFRQVPGAHLTFPDLVAFALRIRGARQSGSDGVVVTEGTDTVEETAFALDLLLEPGPPVVMTGALRHPAQAGADGPANLLNAVRIATHLQASEAGVLVTFDDAIHAAR